MRYSELIAELEYWKRISGEEDPEVVIFAADYEEVKEIDCISASSGIEEKTAIGIDFYE